MGRDLEGRMNAREIVDEAGMCNLPGHYSGRDAITDDLNDKILEKVYQGIQREHGEEAARQFVQMVVDIPKLSATDFLLALYRLEGHGWEWDKRILGNEKGVYLDGSTDEAKIAVGYGTMMSVLSGGFSRDQTLEIRHEFLRRHGIGTIDPFFLTLPPIFY